MVKSTAMKVTATLRTADDLVAHGLAPAHLRAGAATY